MLIDCYSPRHRNDYHRGPRLLQRYWLVWVWLPLDLVAFSKYYKGGFDAKMSKREAGLILGVSPTASKAKIKEAHKRIMLLNHPDRGNHDFFHYSTDYFP
ncbi:hypothetical protein KUTeg_018630 [Tegillarca granosa]|uniref:Uncharacterized protein n=1 Tax=Tegillarca granosa TaxID=220873 RepID=A0ABQ9EJT0_TEGGR|nr:hypothetical protein KUTeg_018630 [Tegillarca granosa]